MWFFVNPEMVTLIKLGAWRRLLGGGDFLSQVLKNDEPGVCCKKGIKNEEDSLGRGNITC